MNEFMNIEESECPFPNHMVESVQRNYDASLFTYICECGLKITQKCWESVPEDWDQKDFRRAQMTANFWMILSSSIWDNEDQAKRAMNKTADALIESRKDGLI